MLNNARKFSTERAYLYIHIRMYMNRSVEVIFTAQAISHSKQTASPASCHGRTVKINRSCALLRQCLSQRAFTRQPEEGCLLERGRDEDRRSVLKRFPVLIMTFLITFTFIL
ncbi:uncharacterized protein LOC110118045 [Ceratitis capitata]|uniref:uncharacterized protein LOC110118045 n=1 Tax=Ceratitis capitata TaxID=7213 RepID=UPI000A103C17|nr:uncharacterized protein LOC110118045 [Ceratitis capitata]